MDYVVFSDESIRTFFITVYSNMGSIFNIAIAVFVSILGLLISIKIFVGLAQ